MEEIKNLNESARLGAINGINRFKDEIESAITSKTGWGKNELAEVINHIASDLINRYSAA